jgi:hypothetical protein
MQVKISQLVWYAVGFTIGNFLYEHEISLVVFDQAFFVFWVYLMERFIFNRRET